MKKRYKSEFAKVTAKPCYIKNKYSSKTIQICSKIWDIVF